MYAWWLDEENVVLEMKRNAPWSGRERFQFHPEIENIVLTILSIL